MRTRYKPWIKEALQGLFNQALIEEPQKYKGVWNNYFRNQNPIYIELGMGKGKFLMQLASENPNINFIGFEVQEGVIYYPAKVISEEGYQNLVVTNEDVKGLGEIFAKKEVSHIYINFCDPWPKNRHAKRRLTHRDFLELYRSILVDGGKLTFKTDNQELFSFSLEEFAAAGCEILYVTRDLHKEEVKPALPCTEYEEKFAARGIPICCCIAGISPNL